MAVRRASVFHLDYFNVDKEKVKQIAEIAEWFKDRERKDIEKYGLLLLNFKNLTYKIIYKDEITAEKVEEEIHSLMTEVDKHPKWNLLIDSFKTPLNRLLKEMICYQTLFGMTEILHFPNS